MLNYDIYKNDRDYAFFLALTGMILTNRNPNAALEKLSTPEWNLQDIFHADLYFIISVEIIDVDYEIIIRSKSFLGSDSIAFKRVSQYIADSLKKHYQVIPFLANEGTYLLGMVDLSNPEIKKIAAYEGGQFLLDSLMDIHKRIHEEMGLCLQMLVGDLVDSIDNLHRELSRVESSDPNEFGPMITFPQVKYIREENRVFISPSDQQFQKIRKLEFSLAKAAAAHNFSKVSDLFLELIDLELSVFPAKKNVTMKSIDRLSMIYSLSGTPPFDPDNQDISFNKLHPEIRNCITVQDLRDIVLTTIAAMQDFHLYKKEEDGNFSQILSFIDKNYTSPTFCCTMICEKFDIQISVFSKQFKERIGMKFIDYLHKRRIDLAKRLLESDHSIRMEDIAAKTGYSNALTFYRAFKRIEGKTPGVYRLEVIHNGDGDFQELF